MMFMIPTPPTSSEMPTMPAATMVHGGGDGVELADELLDRRRPPKLFSSSPAGWRLLRMKNVSSALASSVNSGDLVAAMQMSASAA
jgi:hypothetical protein